MIDLRKHEAFGPLEQPSRAGFNALSLSINDVVPVANATERAQLVTDLSAAGFGPTSARPLYVHRSDTVTLERNVGAGWRVATATRRGNVRLTADTQITGAGGWTTLASVTADTLGGPCVVDFSGIFFNATSGLNRYFAHRVTCDGVLVGTEFLLTAVLASAPYAAFGTDVESSPTAGSHTWALQAHSDVPAAVIVSRASLTVTEHP